LRGRKGQKEKGAKGLALTGSGLSAFTVNHQVRGEYLHRGNRDLPNSSPGFSIIAFPHLFTRVTTMEITLHPRLRNAPVAPIAGGWFGRVPPSLPAPA